MDTGSLRFSLWIELPRAATEVLVVIVSLVAVGLGFARVWSSSRVRPSVAIEMGTEAQSSDLSAPYCWIDLTLQKLASEGRVTRKAIPSGETQRVVPS